MKSVTKKAFIIGLVLTLTGSFAFANGLENKNAIGMYVIGAENSVGGLQYERRFTDIISVKFGTFAMYRSNTYYNNGNEANFNFIVEPDFTLYETCWGDKVSSRLFAFGLAGYDFTKQIDSIWDPDTGKKLGEETKYINSAIAAAGFGFDFIFFGHLSIPVQFGFMGRINTEEPNAGFCAGIGMRYSW